MTTSARPPLAISRTFPLAAADAWDLLADPRHHPRWIPLTRVEVQGSPLAVGWRVVATSGPFARRGAPGVRDRMRLDFVVPPTTSAQGVAVFTKLGPLLLGTAEVRVAPRGDRASIVTWVEDVYLAGPLPPALTRRVLAPVLAGMVRLALWRAAREVASGHEEHPNEG
ncbi:MAG: SRPBCC family protein [Cellulomonas sp.]|nr:SRPBCC family protein [Cellulomonas sp.]